MNDGLANPTPLPCWSDIGVWSPDAPSCPKLKEHVHCRNCEVFASKGRELLDCPPEEDYLKGWAELLASEDGPAEAEGFSAFIFRLEDELLAFPTKALKMVAHAASPHGIPHRNCQYLLGLVNIEGRIKLCFSLKSLLGIESSAAPRGGAKSTPRLVIIEAEGAEWVFPVDETLGVFRCGDKASANIPSTLSKANPAFVKAVFPHEGRMAGLIDEELVVYSLKRSLQ